ncbi:MAG: M48 family metalloprotease [Deltaproteobacteria bacterium]|nr:M48 family metalloprotease [Deltaproteobacteria bacterium]
MKIRPHLLLLLFPLLFGCATFGVSTGTKNSSMDFSKETLRDSDISSYVNQITRTLAKKESKEKLGFSSINVDVLKTSRIQGMSFFDSPSIGITRGMLNVLGNEAELACLIGHEIGHKVLHRHRQNYEPRNKLEKIFIPEDIARAKWNQRQEQEADEYGADLCQKVGYNPYAFLDFMERMARFQKSDFFSAINELSATHKDFRNRAKHLERVINYRSMSACSPPQAYWQGVERLGGRWRRALKQRSKMRHS